MLHSSTRIFLSTWLEKHCEISFVQISQQMELSLHFRFPPFSRSYPGNGESLPRGFAQRPVQKPLRCQDRSPCSWLASSSEHSSWKSVMPLGDEITLRSFTA